LSREEKYSDAQLAEMGIDRATIPRHIAIIMDGNGRWAQKHGWPRVEGHRRGVTSVRSVVEESSRLGMEQLTLYCFSSENWKRPQMELSLLMRLLKQYLVEERRQIQKQGLRFRVIGNTSELDPMIQSEMQKTIDVAAGNDGMMLCLAINYGARLEITDAVKRIAMAVQSGVLLPEDITATTVSDHLMTAGMPDPDLLIRTASEYRISNFLLWQISYSEIWVTDKHWPEFRAEDLRDAIREFARRDRRYGGLTPVT
jgi:undecaprenyl diphosphate synthase